MPGHERRKSPRFHSRLSLVCRFCGAAAGRLLHPPRSRTHFPPGAATELAAGGSVSLGRSAVAYSFRSQRYAIVNAIVTGILGRVKASEAAPRFLQAGSGLLLHAFPAREYDCPYLACRIKAAAVAFSPQLAITGSYSSKSHCSVFILLTELEGYLFIDTEGFSTEETVKIADSLEITYR